MARNPQLSDKARAQVVAAYKRGEKVTDMAERLGINRSTIYWILKQQDLTPDRQVRPQKRAETPTGDGFSLATANTQRLETVEGTCKELLREVGRLAGLIEGLVTRIDKLEDAARRIHPNERI